MRVEKGVFESTIGLLLDVLFKTKDGHSAHKDLQPLQIREELHPQERVSARDQSPHKILNKHKKSGLHMRTENEWL
jgi:hypothetical protein